MVTPKNGFPNDIEDDDDDDLDMPRPPSGGGGILSRFSMPQGIAQTIFVSVIVTMVILAMMSFAGGVSFVTKKDFTDNMANVVASLAQVQTEVNQAKTDVAATQSEVSTALNNLPSQISSQISSSIAQATSQWNSQLSSLSDRLNTLSNNVQSYQTTLNQLQSSMDTNHTAITDLQGDIDGLVVDIDELQVQIDELEEDGGSSSPTIPTITSVVPLSGTSGTSVIIIGTNFTGATSVSFGGTPAQSFFVNSATQITAVVGIGTTGSVVVTTPAGSVASTSVFTYTGGGSPSTVLTTYTPSSVFGLPNVANISITNNSGHDIFGGQFTITIQYIDAMPSPTNMVGLSSTEITWGTTGSISGVSLTVVGTASGVFIMDGQTRIITVNITSPPVGTQFRITNVTYTGWLY